MKITNEEMKKLKQLDRIELVQTLDIVDRTKGFPFMIFTFSIVLFFSGFLFCFAMAFLGAGQYGDKWFFAFINLGISILDFIRFYLVIGAIVCIFSQLNKIRTIRNILKKYFPKKFKEKK